LIRPRGILLAAGASSRFGANKLLQPLPDGTPIALASARNLLQALPGALAVLRPGSEVLQGLLLEAGCQVSVCPDAELGMGHSLAHAVAASAEARGWVVALADMPYIRPQTTGAIADKVEQGALIVAPAYCGKRGHPVGFAAMLRSEMLALRGDEGARGVVQRHAASLQLIEVDDPGVLRDIDRPADLVMANNGRSD
jgi:molybdenum cofactor cytidylyltransferase